MKLNRCLTGKCCSVILAILSVLCIAQVSCGQTPKPLIDKAQALRDVKVKSVYGGKEVVSDEGRFRIVFPDKSVEIYDEVISLHGFQLRIGKTKWSMLYSDLDYSINDNTQAREKYHRSSEAVTGNGSKLIRQNMLCSMENWAKSQFSLKNNLKLSSGYSSLIIGCIQ